MSRRCQGCEEPCDSRYCEDCCPKPRKGRRDKVRAAQVPEDWR